MNLTASAPVRQPAAELPIRGGVAPPSLQTRGEGEEFNMFRISRTTLFKLPGILGWLGPMRMEGFFGQLAGQEFVDSATGLIGQLGHSLSPQPCIHGQRLSFKPTRKLEIGFFRTTVYGGPGYPLAIHPFLRSLLVAASLQIAFQAGGHP